MDSNLPLGRLQRVCNAVGSNVEVKLPCVLIDDMHAGFEPYENMTRMLNLNGATALATPVAIPLAGA